MYTPARLPLVISSLAMFTWVGACEKHHRLTEEPAAQLLDCVVEKRATYTRPVDLLFVIDNSGSMRAHQEALRAQIPRLLEAFASGDLDADGTPEHPAVSDLHVGVISTDMGLPGMEFTSATDLGCGSGGTLNGDDGHLLVHNDPWAHGCTLPVLPAPFLRWHATDTDADAGAQGIAGIADDVACLAALNNWGCGIEQPLEATLKALWPSDNRGNGQPVSLDRPFHGDSSGHGGPGGVNAGFLRNEPGRESLLIVVVLTDENDFSAHDTSHWIPSSRLPASDPLKEVGINLRHLHAPQNLHAVSRYVDGLKTLRHGKEHLVQFVVIAGVPTDLIDPNVDLSDAAVRAAYYDAMLSDPRMQEVEDANGSPANPNVAPSCLYSAFDGDHGELRDVKAYPPRRLVEVARGFGETGLVQSICQDDFTSVADTVLKRTFTALQRSSCVRE